MAVTSDFNSPGCSQAPGAVGKPVLTPHPNGENVPSSFKSDGRNAEEVWNEPWDSYDKGNLQNKENASGPQERIAAGSVMKAAGGKPERGRKSQAEEMSACMDELRLHSPVEKSRPSQHEREPRSWSRSSSASSGRASSSSGSGSSSSGSSCSSFSRSSRSRSRSRSGDRYRRPRARGRRRSSSRSSSRSRSRSRPRCHRTRSRSRCRCHWSPRWYRSRSRSYGRPPRRARSRYRRYRSRTRSRSSSWSRGRRTYGFVDRNRGIFYDPYRSRSRSRSPSRPNIRLSKNDKRELLEIAKANAARALGVDNLELPDSVKAELLADGQEKGVRRESTTLKGLKEQNKKTEAEEESPNTEMSPKNKLIAFSPKNAVAKPSYCTQPGSPESTVKVESKKNEYPYGLWVPVTQQAKTNGLFSNTSPKNSVIKTR